MADRVVCAASELPSGSMRLVEHTPWNIGVFNVDGRLYALGNRCPHAGGPLCLGEVTGTTISAEPYRYRWVRQGEILRCPWHSWEFDIKTGRTITNPELGVKTYPVRVEDGLIVLEC